MFEYGCWILDDGSVVDIDRPWGHEYYLEDCFADTQEYYSNPSHIYHLGYNRGWVRVVAQFHSMDFTAQFGLNKLTRKSEAKLRKLIQRFYAANRHHATIFLECKDEHDESNNGTFTQLELALSYISTYGTKPVASEDVSKAA